MVQLGDSEDREFYSHVDNIAAIPSSWSKFPTKENPLTLYKYASMEI